MDAKVREGRESMLVGAGNRGVRYWEETWR